MLRLIVCLFVVFVASAAQNDWQKVRDLKTGSELMVYKAGVKQPVSAIFDEATEENLIVVVKNQQTAIPKADIERVDARDPKKGSRVTKESKTVVKDAESSGPHIPGSTPSGQSTSTSTSMSFGGKGSFETVYRRTIAPK